MRNRKIEFDTECRPGAAVTDLRLLDRRIGIEHRLPADLIDAGVQVTADIGQDAALQIFVFEKQRAPGDISFPAGEVLAQCIGIIEPGNRENVERRVWIRRPFDGYRQRERALPDADLSGSGGETTQKNRQRESGADASAICSGRHEFSSLIQSVQHSALRRMCSRADPLVRSRPLGRLFAGITWRTHSCGHSCVPRRDSSRRPPPEFERIRTYVETNPVKAGLVRNPLS